MKEMGIERKTDLKLSYFMWYEFNLSPPKLNMLFTNWLSRADGMYVSKINDSGVNT